MTASTLELTTGTFDAVLSSAEGPVLVDFWAAWCGPCRALAPTLEAFAADHAGRVTVGKVDVDANPELAVRFGVRSIPTLILFRDGVEVDRLVGNLSRTELERRVGAASAA